MEELRQLLSRALSWADAHVSAEEVLNDYPEKLQGRIIPGQNYSPYQLLEHMRIAQKDILDFSRDPGYVAPNWPADYWPKESAPASKDAWQRAVRAFFYDREEMILLIQDESKDLFQQFSHGTGQHLARQAILLIDHNAYHLGQMALFRKMQGDDSRKIK